MATGTLPFFTPDQQTLIAMVTAPEEWAPTSLSLEDKPLLDLLAGILRCAKAEGLRAHELSRNTLHTRTTQHTHRADESLVGGQAFARFACRHTQVRRQGIGDVPPLARELHTRATQHTHRAHQPLARDFSLRQPLTFALPATLFLFPPLLKQEESRGTSHSGPNQAPPLRPARPPTPFLPFTPSSPFTATSPNPVPFLPPLAGRNQRSASPSTRSSTTPTCSPSSQPASPATREITPRSRSTRRSCARPSSQDTSRTSGARRGVRRKENPENKEHTSFLSKYEYCRGLE